MDQQQTVVGIFRSPADAHLAAKRLADAGFAREKVDVAARMSAGMAGSTDASDYRNTSGTAVEGAADAVGRTADRAGDALARAAAPDRDPSDYRNSSGTAVEGAADAAGRTGDSIGGFFSSLFGGDDNEDTRRYAEVARQPGMSVVTVHCHSAENAHEAARLLDEAGAVDVDEQASQLGLTGQSGGGWMRAGRETGAALDTNVSGDGMSAKVIEENMQVGKRTEQTGGARLRSRIVERPVEEHVRLREERVTVERTPVNRVATEADFTAFKEGEITVTETAERAVVQKEARVVEEVNLRKEVTERDEVVRDTVRSTEVDVEQLSAEEMRRRETSGMGSTGTGTGMGGATSGSGSDMNR